MTYVCQSCKDVDLPLWQKVLLAPVGVALALGVLWVLNRLLTLGAGRRDAHLRKCFLGIQRAWASPDAADRLAGLVTPEMLSRLRDQRDSYLAVGQMIHHEGARVEKLVVISGGGKRDSECVAQVRYSVRSWTTDATGAVVTGSREPSPTDSRCRFVRGPSREWLADEISVE